MLQKSNNSYSIFILSTAALIVVAQLYVSIPLIAVLAHYFSVPSSKVVWIGGGFSFAYAAGFLFFGPLSDRYGRKNLLVPGLFVLGLITISIGFTEDLSVLLMERILQGFIAATFAPAALAYIGENLSPNSRSTGLAMVSTGFMSAGVLGQLYASYLSFHFSWHAIFITLGSAYIAYSMIIYFTLYEENLSEGQKSNMSLFSFYKQMGIHLKNTKLLSLYLCAFVLLFNFVAMYSGLFPYLRSIFNLNSEDLFRIRAIGLVGVGVAPFSGKLIKWCGLHNLLIASFMIIAITVLIEAFSSNYLNIMISSIFFVGGVSLAAPCLITLISINAKQAKGAAISLYTFILFMGAGLGSIIANLLEPFGFLFLSLIITISSTVPIILFVVVFYPSLRKPS